MKTTVKLYITVLWRIISFLSMCNTKSKTETLYNKMWRDENTLKREIDCINCNTFSSQHDLKTIKSFQVKPGKLAFSCCEKVYCILLKVCVCMYVCVCVCV